jgi:hypothetical protein
VQCSTTMTYSSCRNMARTETLASVLHGLEVEIAAVDLRGAAVGIAVAVVVGVAVAGAVV